MNESIAPVHKAPELQVTTFRDFQTNCTLLENSLRDSGSDPRPDLQKLQTWVRWVNDGHGSPAHETYLYSTSLPRVANGFLRRSFARFPDGDVLTQIVGFLRELAMHLVRRLHTSTQLLADMETLHALLDPSHNFYMYHGVPAWNTEIEVEEEEAVGDAIPLATPPQVGDAVDAYHAGKHVWMQGVVLDMKDEMEVYVGFYGMEATGDRWLPREHLAPLGAKAKEHRRGHGPIRTELDEDIPDANDSDRAPYMCALLRPRVPCSRFFVDVLNAFGSVGGFQKLPLFVLQPPINVAMVATVVSLIANVLPWVTRPLAHQLVRQTEASLHLHCPEMELRNMTKPMMDTLHACFKKICRRLYVRLDASRKADELLLGLCLRCLESDVLEHRLHGLRCLTDFLPLIRHAKTHPLGVKLVASSLASSYPSSAASSYVLISLPISEATDEASLASWCETHHLLSLLCNAHEQVIRRGVDVVRFLCEAHRFGLAELHQVWDAVLSTSTGADVRASLFFLLESIIAWLSEPICKELLRLLRAYPTPSVHVVHLVGSIAKHAPMDEPLHLTPRLQLEPIEGDLFSRHAACRCEAIELLWGYLHDTTDDGRRQLYEPAKAQLQESIDANIDADDRPSLLEEPSLSPLVLDGVVVLLTQCVDRVNAHTDVPQALGILGYLLHLFPSDHWKLEIIAWLHARHIVQHILDDLVDFKAALPIDETKDALDDMNAALLRRGSHVDFTAHLKARLGFLSLLCELVPQSHSLAHSHLAVLWDALLVRSVLPSERSMLFKWLIANAMHLTKNAVAYVFESLLSDVGFLKSPSLSPLALSCVLCYFRLMNDQAGTLVLAPSATTAPCTTNAFVVQSLPLRGMDALLTMLLEASHATVFAQTLRFVALLPFKLGPNAGTLDLVTLSLERLEPPTLERALVLLSTFVGTDVASATALATGRWVPHSSNSRGSMLTLLLSNSIKGTPTVGAKVPLVVYANDTVLQMQVAATLALQVPMAVQYLRFFRAGREIQELTRCLSLSDAGFKDGDTILVSQRPNLTPASATESDLPIVLSPTLFPKLLSLMDSHVEAWNLLLRLPTPASVVDAIRKHESEWSALLSSSHMSQLLYRLQVLDGLLVESRFLDSFVATHGPSCILKTFLSLRADSGASGFEAYVQHESALVSLRLLTRFLYDGAAVHFPKQLEWDADLWVTSDLATLPARILAAYDNCVTPSTTKAPGIVWANDDMAALCDACLLWMQVCVQNDLHGLLDTLCTLFVLAAPTFQRLPSSAVLHGLVSTQRPIRLLIAHTLVLLSKTTDVALDADTAAAIVLLLREFEGDSVEYVTLLGLFVLAAGDVVENAATLFESYATSVSCPVTSATFLSDVPHTQLFGDPLPTPLEGALFVLRCTLHSSRKLQTFQPQLLLDLWHAGLFAYPTTSDGPWHPRCSTPSSRHAAFQLLLDLCNMPSTTSLLENGNLAFVMEQVPPILATLTRVYEDWEWAFDPHSVMKSSTGRVGLRNLGCTCYLNSTLQQLFYMPRFRDAILSLPVDPGMDVVTQTQRLFGHLAATEQKCVDPTPLLHCLHDEAGGPLNVMMQQDAEEFLTRFVDGVTEYLKTTPAHTNALDAVFGGTLCTQLCCQGGCGSVRETAATSFVCMTVEVKGHDSLLSSLRNWSAGEMLSGVNCDACGSKQDTIKRDCVETAPETLLLHLKRFELNFDTFLREKVNDAFAFPLSLDLFPYTKAGLDAPDAHASTLYYDLVGCVVHLGSTESGHYYSLVLDRVSGKWLELNDDTVSYFDLRLMESECFGGPDASGSSSLLLNTKSAYILVYEKQGSASSLATMSLPSGLADDLRRENKAFVQACYAHDPNFLAFLSALLTRLPPQDEIGVDAPLSPFLHACVRGMHVYARAHVLKPLPLISLLTTQLRSPTLCQSLLAQYASHPSHVVEMLLYCPKAAVRSEFAAFLSHLVVGSLPVEGELLALGLTGPSLFGKLLDQLFTLSMLDAIVLSWRTMGEFFEFFKGAALADARCRDLMRMHKCGMYLLDLFLGEASPLIGSVYPPYSRKRLPKVPSSHLTPILELVAVLYEGQSPTSLDAETRSCLLLKTLYVRMFQCADHAKALATLLVEWCTEWDAFTQSVIDVVGHVLSTLQISTTSSLLGLWVVLDPFFGLEDSLQGRRAHDCLVLMWRSIQSHRGVLAQAQAIGLLLALGSVHAHVHAELQATLGVWGPWVGPLLATVRKQPWAFDVTTRDGSSLEWCHALSYDRVAQYIAEANLCVPWLEAPAEDEADDRLHADADATAFLWDNSLD
ncbi:hypothetical protein SPRG_04658 [Saprolegnia parasitica CBS 223.65]|uniref:USP domain-containing protein n=1 Tax=Saprolegnia parasitica (strain CBS 223.65) TaxID=695850 RepID=A0A067CVE6_SAPPC|nr:hypothetical protein SPRG_04658 [Saprolegnia parasitica CBS 223.65]KDO30757.1 hypothetical protein SPRG_04658 [Saprolegnia parasitica CBS 223.65]|eukprot:XP_012198456.1 hypothetical protein SPRG_04658 [Saprolegnia parasitica CBS 223.65]